MTIKEIYICDNCGKEMTESNTELEELPRHFCCLNCNKEYFTKEKKLK